jgi:hypothetical protein
MKCVVLEPSLSLMEPSNTGHTTPGGTVPCDVAELAENRGGSDSPVGHSIVILRAQN